MTRPVLLIASDTPQVTAGLLAECARALLQTDVVFGLARDGGWWVLGVTDPAMADCLNTIPTSRSDTGPATLEALRDKGLAVTLVEPNCRTSTPSTTWNSFEPPAHPTAGSCTRSGRRGLYDARAISTTGRWTASGAGSAATTVRVRHLPVRQWLGGRHADGRFRPSRGGVVQGSDDRLGLRSRTIGDRARSARYSGAGCRSVRDGRRRWRAAVGRPVFVVTCSSHCRAPAAGRRCCLPTAMSGWAVIRFASCAGLRSCWARRALRRRIRTRSHRVSAPVGCGSNRRGQSVRGSAGPRSVSTARPNSPKKRACR